MPKAVDTPAPKQFPASLGASIKHYREKAAFTQLELAHAIGYTGPEAGSYISRLESGQQQPRVSTLHRLALALGIDAEALMKRKS